jgi:hypothetical protein
MLDAQPTGVATSDGSPGMTQKPPRIPDYLQAWITARKRHSLSHAHVQMARELGMNPKKLGKLDNADQEPWKLPLPAFIESLYRKRFGKDRPDLVQSIEERARLLQQKKAVRREAKRLRREAAQ